MAIDNQPMYIDMSSAPSNIAIVAYNCETGLGLVEYNDRLKLFDAIGDMSPYLPFFNQWLTIASTFTQMPLTLSQAKYVQTGLIDAYFNSKRQAPIAYGGFTWDASDAAVARMMAVLAAWDVASAASAADAQLAANVNAMSISTSASLVNPGSGGVNFGTGISASSSHSGVSAPGAVKGPVVPWPPYQSTTLINMTMSDMRGLIDAINQRRNNLAAIQQSKITAVNHIGTIPQVIAYDITAGW